MATDFWIKTNAGSLGPFDWKLLREWFALKWLPPETDLAESKDGPWQQAHSVSKLWKETKGIAKRIEDFEIVDLESEKLPLSSALKKRLHELGLPGDVELLRNYYWGNKLRETLESLFPDASRALFDDLDWPKCWSWPCPAAAELQQQVRSNEPLTAAQNEVLMFFVGANHGFLTKSVASEKIGELLDDAQNNARWEDHKSRIQATDRQTERLKWWAEKLGRRLPSPLMKAQAGQLIDDWLEEHPELEDAWYQYKERREDFEIEVAAVSADVDDWREFHNCGKVSEKTVRNVLAVIGQRKSGEPLDQFMNRFFAELRKQYPTMFNTPEATLHPLKQKKGCLILCLTLLLLLTGALGALAKYLVLNLSDQPALVVKHASKGG